MRDQSETLIAIRDWVTRDTGRKGRRVRVLPNRKTCLVFDPAGKLIRAVDIPSWINATT